MIAIHELGPDDKLAQAVEHAAYCVTDILMDLSKPDVEVSWNGLAGQAVRAQTAYLDAVRILIERDREARRVRS